MMTWKSKSMIQWRAAANRQKSIQRMKIWEMFESKHEKTIHSPLLVE